MDSAASCLAAALASALVVRSRRRNSARRPAPATSRVRVRAVRASDEAEWRALWRGYHTFYEACVPDAVYRSTFARVVGEGGPFEVRGLVAEEQGGRLLGLAHYMGHRHGWHIENIVYLQDLFVLPRARGRGVGRQLIEAVYRAADEAGTPLVYWSTHHTNHTARRLYDRVGANSGYIKYKRPR